MNEIKVPKGQTVDYVARDEDGDVLGRITLREHDGYPSYDPASNDPEPGVELNTGRWKSTPRTFTWRRYGELEREIMVTVRVPDPLEEQQPDPQIAVVSRQLVAVPNDHGHQIYRITVDASQVANLRSVAVMVLSRRHSAPGQVGTTLAHGWTTRRQIADPAAVVVDATGPVWRGAPAVLHVTARGTADGRGTRCYVEDRWDLDRAPIEGLALPTVRVADVEVLDEPAPRRSMRGQDGVAMSVRLRRPEGYSGGYRASARNGDYHEGRDEDGWVVFRFWRARREGQDVELAYRITAYDEDAQAEGPTDGYWSRTVPAPAA